MRCRFDREVEFGGLDQNKVADLPALSMYILLYSDTVLIRNYECNSHLHILVYVSILESLKKVIVDPPINVPYCMVDWSARSSAFSV